MFAICGNKTKPSGINALKPEPLKKQDILEYKYNESMRRKHIVNTFPDQPHCVCTDTQPFVCNTDMRKVKKFLRARFLNQ